ncbi:phosphopantothenoylcysteine decarboxylase isoform X2 [Dipodomys merriami]|uniref:phosphopantothenoylcysteine decarboxylase isoform X2 n=1 Tax=Dipodomys merriami TaxID=94247 RepID=UPI003855E226
MDPPLCKLPELEAAKPQLQPQASCLAATPGAERKFHVLVGVTGSVAALKLPLLVSKLLEIPGGSQIILLRGLEVRRDQKSTRVKSAMTGSHSGDNRESQTFLQPPGCPGRPLQ